MMSRGMFCRSGGGLSYSIGGHEYEQVGIAGQKQLSRQCKTSSVCNTQSSLRKLLGRIWGCQEGRSVFGEESCISEHS